LSRLGKVGFNKLFSFGNFVWVGQESSFAVYELFIFVALGVIGGLIGAVFNNTNEKITIWRRKHINHSKKRRFIEVCILSIIVSCVTFLLPLCWTKCTPLPTNPISDQEAELFQELVPFRCKRGEEYNELASLYFTEPGVAIRMLFHLHRHAFSDTVLLLFFIPYISMAVVVYGIAGK
jgi:chloride channel 7